MSFYERSKELHKWHQGKIRINAKMEVRTTDDLSLVYSPGVAGPSQAIADDPASVWDYTIKGNTVAVVSDGSAVLGLGNIGPHAAIPVMEGKAMLFKKFAGVDAFPICLDTQDTEEIISTIRILKPVFGGINLEDISSPRCFEIEDRLQDIGIPVFHDDQHGTAIVVLAGLINAVKVVGKELKDMKVVINGSGAAGIAIARLLRCVDHSNESVCIPVKEILMCDRKGVINRKRDDLTTVKKNLLAYTNPEDKSGDVYEAIKGADVFIGVSQGDLLKPEHIETMEKDAIVFALANPQPEILPDDAIKGGAAIVATGRSDYPNQVNNVLGFPGIFRGALDAKAKRITPMMKLAAVHAIAGMIKYPRTDLIIPPSLNISVASAVAKAVQKAAIEEMS